jgi:hypothetical protein
MPNLPKRILAVGIMAAAAVAGNGIGPAPEPPRAREAPAPSTGSRAFGPIHPRVSPAGDQIDFSYQGALWRMPRAGGVMTRLTDGAGFDVERGKSQNRHMRASP